MIKFRLTLLLLLILSGKNLAQVNLVPNPSFEDTLFCPTSPGEMMALNNWVNCSISPDYYHSCATGSSAPSVGVPSNWAGYQNAVDGNAYVGLGTFITSSQREIIGVQLTQPLTVGTRYYISAYISRQDSSNGTIGYACSANRFGFRFSSVAYSWANANPAPIDNYSHYFENAIIFDTLNWVKVSGSLIADSTYSYFMIGNFFDNSNTNTTGCFSALHLAYYYVDMVCVSTDSATCNNSMSFENTNKIPKISMFPNPCVSILTIEIPEHPDNCKLIIQSSGGQIIKQANLIAISNEIDISDLSPGLYFAQIIYNNKLLNYKLIKI